MGLLCILIKHKDKTVTEWDTLAKKYKYPASSRLIYVFGLWNGVKVTLTRKVFIL